MKASLFFATLVMAFGLFASGCAENGGGSKGKSPNKNNQCESGERFSEYYDECLEVSSCSSGEAIIPGTNQCGPIDPGFDIDFNNGSLRWITGRLNKTNSKKFASFIESWGYTTYGRAFCVDNRDDINFFAGWGWLGFNWNVGLFGTQDCNTYDAVALWIGLNKQNVALDESTVAQVFLRVRSSGTQIDIKLPHDAQFSVVRRANQDQQFLIQGYLYKLTHPQDWAYWYVEGPINSNADITGGPVSVKWDGSVMATSNTNLFQQ